jgi:hypothetical protein
VPLFRPWSVAGAVAQPPVYSTSTSPPLSVDTVPIRGRVKPGLWSFLSARTWFGSCLSLSRTFSGDSEPTLYSAKLTPSGCWRVPVLSPGPKPRRVIEFSQRLGAVSYQSFGKDWWMVYVSTLPRPVLPARARSS